MRFAANNGQRKKDIDLHETQRFIAKKQLKKAQDELKKLLDELKQKNEQRG